MKTIEAATRMCIRGEFRMLLGELRRRCYSNEVSLGLRRDLAEPFETPRALLPLRIRPLESRDIPHLIEGDDKHLDEESRKDRERRLLMISAGIPICYVAVTVENRPVYMQWLFTATENDKVQKYFRGGFPVLGKEEGLLEFAFTVETYRGKRVMANAMAEIALKGRESGVRWIHTFVREDNVPSLKGCKRAGFVPYMRRLDKWRLFRKKVTFSSLPVGTVYEFDKGLPSEAKSHGKA